MNIFMLKTQNADKKNQMFTIKEDITNLMNWKTHHNSDENPLNLCADLMQLKEGRDATKTFPPGQDLKANGLLKILRNGQLSCDTIFS